MMKKLLFLPLLLLVVAAGGVPIVRIVSTNGPDSAFATDNVHKLVLSTDTVEVVSNEGSVLLSVPLTEILRVELTDGTPDPGSATETVLQDDETAKILEHGHVYILHSGRKYTVMGIEVEHK